MIFLRLTIKWACHAMTASGSADVMTTCVGQINDRQHSRQSAIDNQLASASGKARQHQPKETAASMETASISLAISSSVDQ